MILTAVLVIIAFVAAFGIGRSIKRKRAAAAPASASRTGSSSAGGYSPSTTGTTADNSSWFAAMIAGISDSGSHRSSDSGSQYGGSGSHHSSHDSGSSYDSGSSFDGGSW